METYELLDPREHVLKRPSVYVGSVEHQKIETFVVDEKDDKYIGAFREISYSPALFKILDEILTNSLDHVTRTQSEKNPDNICNTIELKLVGDDTIICANNGRCIPITEKEVIINDKKQKIYIPQMLFGHLLSGSNFNDNEKRRVGGQNGMGASLTNIFSTVFEVTISNKETGQVYSQTWRDNMTQITKPKITTPKNGVKNNRIEIKFTPDFIKFGYKKTEFDVDMKSLILRRAYDLSVATSDDVNIKLNGRIIHRMKTAEQYGKFFGLTPYNIDVKCSDKNCYWNVAVAINKNSDGVGTTNLTFINGINTALGGTHVDLFVRKLSEIIGTDVPRRVLLGRVVWIIFGQIYNPTFESQVKMRLESPLRSWGVNLDIDEKSLKNFIKKSGLSDDISSLKNTEDLKKLAKTDGNKKRFVNISKASWDDAPLSGTARSSECKLFLVEGNSASSLFKNGKTAENAHTIGVYPLRGVPINSRIASIKDIAANDEFNDLKQILGLREGMVYTKDNIKTLRYGKLLIAADQDPDGGKIKMLIINHLERFWPSLFEIGFVSFFTTPLIRASRGVGKKMEIIEFFSQSQFDLWAKNKSISAYKIKWLKGLASSDNNDAKRYMQNIMGNSKRIKLLAADKPFLEQMFGKDSEPRKVLLMNKLPTELDYTRSEYDVSELLHSEYLDYMFYSLKRAIPHMIDGLKDVNRKIVFGAKQLKLGVEMNVSNFASFVKEQTDYHHAPSSLEDSIAQMSICYTGANNFALLNSHSQNGSRVDSEHGASRYIFISKNKLIDMIFNNRDDPLLKWKDDVDQGSVKKMEPEFYCPILPYVLLNGNEGIAVGYSTSIPPFKPVDIIQWIFAYLSRPVGDDKIPSTSHFVPYYRGFIGKIERNVGQPSFTCSGCIERIGSCTYKISEILPEMTIAIFKAHLIKLVEKGIVLSYDNLSYEAENKEGGSDQVIIDIRIETAQDYKTSEEMNELIKILKLTGTISIANIHLLNPDGLVKKYTIQQILAEFSEYRLDMYKKRIAHELKILHETKGELDERIRFIRAVVSGEIVIFKRPRSEVLNDMDKMRFTNREYLQIAVGKFTLDEINKLLGELNDIISKINGLMNTSPAKMWIGELTELCGVFGIKTQ